MEIMQRVEEKRSGLVRGMFAIELFEAAKQLGVADEQSIGRVIRVAILPMGSDYEPRTMPPDYTRDQPPVFRRVDNPAVGKLEALARCGAHELGGLNGFAF